MHDPLQGAVFAAGEAGHEGHVVDLAYDAVWGFASPGDLVTVTRSDDAYGVDEANGVGFFYAPLWGLDGRPADVGGGDTLEVYFNGALDEALNPVTITGQVDVVNDRVVGTVLGAAAGEVVTVTVGTWAFQASFLGAPRTTATTDASGVFTAAFAANDLGAHHYARIAIGGPSSAQHSYLYPQDVFHVDTFAMAFGFTEPRQVVTATIVRDGIRLTSTTARAGWPHGEYGLELKIEPGDVVELDLGSGPVMSTTAYTLTARIDVEADQVTGICPPLETVRVWSKDWQLGTFAETSATADASGRYTATFTGHDLRPSDRVHPSYADDEGDEVLLSMYPPNIIARVDQGSVLGAGDAPKTPFTATLLHDGSTSVVTGTTTWGNDLGMVGFAVSIEEGDTITVETSSWTGSMTVADVDVALDGEDDSVSSQADITGWMKIWVDQWNNWLYPVHSRVAVSVAGTSPVTTTFPRFDLRDGCRATVFHFDDEGFTTWKGAMLRQFGANMPWGVWVDGASPSDVVTASLYHSDGVTLKRRATSDAPEPWGGRWLGMEGHIRIGDWLTVTDSTGWIRGFQMPTLTINADPDTDTVWGQGPSARLLAEHDPDGNWSGLFIPGGEYLLDWSSLRRDLRKGDYVNAAYQTPGGNVVGVQAEWLSIELNYAHDWVEGHLEAGHTLWLTITESDGLTVKATAELKSQAIPWWGGNTGFSTSYGDPWVPDQPDIQAGDWAFLKADDGRTTSVHVGTIDGQLDIEADTLSGTISTPWFTETLRAWCGVWEEGGPWEEIEVEPDGDYLCDLGDMGWDLLPEQDVAVQYLEPDSDQVYNVFRELGSRLGIQAEAESEPAEGGNYSYRIRYRNDGEGPAEDVVITSTVQGMAYLEDTSPFAVTTATVPGGEQIVWDLGTVPGQTSDSLDLFVRVTGVQSDSLANSVEIGTSNPFDQAEPGEKVVELEGHVEANDTHLTVGAWTRTGDPAPGADFICVVNVCNAGTTASTAVVVTDTLHPSLTMQSWSGQFPGWTEVKSDDHELVLTRPSIPGGGWCSEVDVQVRVDAAAWAGLPISHSAVITASNDLDEGDNTESWEGQLGDPRINLHVRKELEWGFLVPGGEIGYSVMYENRGNISAESVLITDTLPEHTRFDHSWFWIADGEIPVAPTLVTGDYVVWDAGTLIPGEYFNLGFRVTIDSGASPGDILTNSVGISLQPDEEAAYDNVATWVETVHPAGPNLRVSKYHYWESEDRIKYGIWVRNMGTTSMEDIWIADTYPVSTTSDGDWWMGHGPWVTQTHHPGDRQFTFWVEALDPGGTSHFGFWVDLDDAIRGQQGLVFTNTVHGAWPGDVFPADNGEVELAFTGPDVYVEKWLSGGQPKTGELVTFTVEFGNRNLEPWNGDGQFGSHITDTLPAEMRLVDVVAPWDPHWMPYEQEGNVLTWEWDAMWSESRWRFDVVAQITDTVRGGDVIVNRVEAGGDSPGDIEPYYDNNVFELPITLLGPRGVYLPLIVKN
ncbi:MAG: hypothetical protein PVH41_06550 [Anaerolineae bacterium]